MIYFFVFVSLTKKGQSLIALEIESASRPYIFFDFRKMRYFQKTSQYFFSIYLHSLTLFKLSVAAR